MLLIVEIVLTVIAWRRGWGAHALLPLVFALVGGTAFVAVTGASVGVAFAVGLLLDLAVFVALVVMAITGPRPEPTCCGSADRAAYRSPAVPRSLSRYGAFESPTGR
jgi:hypothetical protein